MRVLVTGGAGFVGWHVVQQLLLEDHEPCIIDNLYTGAVANVPDGVRFYRHDVREPLDDVMRSARPEAVIHLAAQVSVRESTRQPMLDASINVDGTINVVSAAARYARKIIFVSSAAVYGTPARLPIRETDRTGAISPYGLSKLTAEQYVRLLAPLYGLSHTILRPANIYGPRQMATGDGAVVPAFIARFLSGQAPTINGDGTQTRDFVYVADMARALTRALTDADDTTLNVSSGQAVSIIELWRKIARMIGWSGECLHGPRRPGDITHSVLDTSECCRCLGWRPETALDTGLAETLSWAMEVRKKKAPVSKVTDVSSDVAI